MSKVIDERVVEMRFDNKDFESNVQTSLKTIDKLKDSLNFDESTKSVEKFQDSLKHFSLDDIGNAVESLSSKFNWSNIFKMELLSNVTEQIFSTITGVFNRIKGELQLEDIDPISNMIGGWDKYAEKTKSVATIMASTGKSMEYVDEQMQRLLYFADETSYSFTDMTGNIGKFTANGIELEDASTAMQGIATWAARSGQNAQTASRVMYNLAQAIGMGALKLQDWKSVELANMGTKEFKEMAIQAGLATKTLTHNAEGLVVINDETVGTVKETEVSIENFRETLKDGWLDNETLMSTLQEYGKAADLINNINAETGLQASKIIEMTDKLKGGKMTLKEFAKALKMEDVLEKDKDAIVELKQAFELLGSEEYSFSLETYKAAQEARTFGDAMGSVADYVGSKWMETFELLFGGYEQAKVLWTDLAENLAGIFGEGIEARNELLEEANVSGFEQLQNSLEASGASMSDLEQSLREVIGTGALRTLRDEAGSFEEALKQGKFNIDDLGKAIDGLPNSFKVVKEIAGEVSDNYEEMTEWSWELRKGMYDYVGHDDQVQKLMAAKNITKEYAEQVVTLSEKHQELGRELTREEAEQWITYTEGNKLIEENIELTEEQREEWKAMLEELDQRAFREGLTNGLMNLGTAIYEIVTRVREVIHDMFPPATASQLRILATNFQNITADILDFVTTTEDKTSPLYHILLALATPFRILADVIGVVIKLITPLGKLLLGVLAPIGFALETFGKFVENVREGTGQLQPFSNVISKIGDALEVVIDFLGKVGAKLFEIIKLKIGEKITNPFRNLASVIEKFSSKSVKRINNFIETVKNADIDAIAQRIADGLASIYRTAKEIFAPITNFFKEIKARFDYLQSLKEVSGFTTLQNAIAAIRWTASTTFRDLLGKLAELGVDTDKLEQRFNSIKTFFDGIWTSISSFFQPVIDFFKEVKDRFDYLQSLKEVSGFTTLQNALAAIRWTASNTFGDLIKKVSELMPALDPVINKLTEIYNSIKTFFTGLKGGNEDESIFTKLKNNITDGTGALDEFISGLGITLPKVLTGGGIALAGAGIFKLIKGLKGTKENGGKNVIENLVDSLNPFSDTIEKLKTATSSFNIKNFAISMAILAGALIALSFVPSEKLVVSLGSLGTALAEFIGTIAAVNKIMGDKGTFRLIGIGAGMILIAGSLLLFASALNKLKDIDISSNSDILKILGGLLLAVTSMGRLAKVAGKANFKLSNGLGLVATAGALWLFGKALESYANLKIDRDNILKALGGLLVAIVTLSTIAKVVGKANFKFSNGVGLILLATTLYMFAGLIAILGHMDIGTLIQGGLCLAALGLALAAMVKLITKASEGLKFGQAAGTFVILTGVVVAVLGLAAAIAILGIMPVDVLIKGGIAMAAIGVFLYEMTAAMAKIGKTTELGKAAASFLIMIGVVAAIAALAIVIAAIGVLGLPVAAGIVALLFILGELYLVFEVIKDVIAPNIKAALKGILAIGLFGLALIPLVYVLKELGQLDFETTQKNLVLLGELLLGFLALIGVATIVGGLATAAGPILLVGMGVVAGIFALFVGAITVLVKDLERLADIDTESAKAGLELVKEELNILTDLAREFQENSGLFTASLGAAIVCLEFGKGLHELATDTMILGLANASQASESLKVVKEEISMMIELGDYLAQNEGSFGRAITASATAYSFGVGLHGLANDTMILGLTNAENAKAAIEPMNDLIGIMLGLAESIGSDPGLFVKALVTSADMIAFGIGLLPLVGVEFLAGLADAPTVTANMTQLTSLIDSLFGLAEKVGADASLYFSAKGTAEAIKDFGYALLPLIASEFLSQFVDAEASTAGFEATKKVVQWLLDIAGYFQGEDSINLGAGAAVDRLNGFAKSLAKLTVVDFFSQFVSAENALEGLKPVQTIVDMLVGMVTELSGTEGMAETAKTTVEAVKTFAGSLTDIMWTLNSGAYSNTDTSSVTTVIGAITDGITQLASVGGNMANVSLALEGIGDIFESLGSISTKGGIFGKKSVDTSGITTAFDAIGQSVTDLANTIVQQDVGNQILETIINPITGGVSTATAAVASLAQAISDTVASFETAFQVDGNNLAVGMINGIYSRVQDAYDAGYQLGSDAERGVRDAGDIHSPSKVFEKLGGYLGEGFVEGIESKYSQVTDAARLMTQHAIDIASELKERVKQYLAEKENEFVLTPVLDMDGVSKISRLMSNMQGTSSYVTNHMNSAAVESGIRSSSVTPELRSLQEQIALLGEHMDNMQVVLDTGTLVGATSAKMDSQFGIMSMRRGRGN